MIPYEGFDEFKEELNHTINERMASGYATKSMLARMLWSDIRTYFNDKSYEELTNPDNDDEYGAMLHFVNDFFQWWLETVLTIAQPNVEDGVIFQMLMLKASVDTMRTRNVNAVSDQMQATGQPLDKLVQQLDECARQVKDLIAKLNDQLGSERKVAAHLINTQPVDLMKRARLPGYEGAKPADEVGSVEVREADAKALAIAAMPAIEDDPEQTSSDDIFDLDQLLADVEKEANNEG